MSKHDVIINTLMQSQISEMLDLIRVRKNSETSVELLREYMDISRSTADRIYNGLNGKDGPALVYRNDRRTLIHGEKAYFLGISIGSRYIRTALLGLDFTPVDIGLFYPFVNAQVINGYNADESDSSSYAFEIPSDTIDKLSFIRSVVSPVVSFFIDLAEAKVTFPLLGIGFGVAGPVDYDRHVWRSAPRMQNLQNIEIADIVGYSVKKRMDDLGLYLSIDNNSKTAIISEYQYLLEKTNGQYSEDLALIYIGSGVGLAAVIDGKLLRGGKNMSGELGHIQLLFSDSNGEKEGLRSFSSKTVEDLLINEDENSLALYLPHILNLVCCMLGVNRFILVGHSVSKTDNLCNTYETITDAIMDQRMKFTVASTQIHCSAEIGRGLPYTSAIGAAIESYYTLCNYKSQSIELNRTNLAQEIAWRHLKN